MAAQERIHADGWMIYDRLLLSLLLCLISLIYCSLTAKSMTDDNLRLQPPHEDGNRMRVLWTVSGYRICNDDAVWGDEEARNFLFKPLDITASTIIFDGEKCSNIVFEQNTVNLQEYLQKFFPVTAQQLDIIDKKVLLITTNCDLPGFREYLRLRDGRLIIYVNGVFFYLEPSLNR